MAEALVFVFCLLAFMGFILFLGGLADHDRGAFKFGLGMIGITAIFFLPSSLYIEYSGKHTSVVLKDEPNVRYSQVFCLDQCANVPDEIVISGKVRMSNGDGVNYELTIVPHDDYFGFFVASLPYAEKPLKAEVVKKYLLDMLAPEIFSFLDYIEAKPVFEELKVTKSKLITIKLTDVERGKFYIELWSYYQPILLVHGWQIKDMTGFDVVRHYASESQSMNFESTN